MSNPNTELPSKFRELETWVDGWVLPDGDARCAKRLNSPMTEIQAFYDAVLPQAPAVLEFLDQRKLGEMEPGEERLLKLMLSFAEVIPAVEFYGQPSVIDGFPPEKFFLSDPLSDLTPQA